MSEERDRDGALPPESTVGPLAGQLVSLTTELLAAGSLVDVLERVVVMAKDVVGSADLVSVTLRGPDGAFHTPVLTDAVAAELDQLQYEFGEGACVECARPAGPAAAYSPDLAVDPRWPRFGAGASQRGFHSLASAALLPDAAAPRLSGALNAYSREPHVFDQQDRDALMLLATHASLALTATEGVTRAQLLVEQLRDALDSRDVIGQAKGILMARRGVGADEAFDTLRRASQNINVKLRELAKTLVARHHTLDPLD
ncbi:GAF and ANTAR domain-containing protein [Actinokineospora auranticolor]|uniref:GAF domain-containing protein n=1 Tax=Actinokineospora auranticolor TaxID=155976 RepID=A0A2S6GJP8_9PSEU|nr:GAF and ANTAR domain-containing protein [Actinokineospora auranticolor]PPK65458.1 GAF domain-containing protein [Actinokineospora auranticolor]